ncbi:hypothetical protein BEL04_11655 [Mucilaginibacter sp. PPCGB 2223]|uniref:hypothetical protein n=1 Tax=Mucilaginibacter sp. PPCGB 2223 TaxID=1886027 RepID=UPI00082571E9|nr:hypothetical protein [Mucilaginibacter sp. PPCGB 2223]OCX52141.1 hypothetical protein BEL04_11655 [Mucilaginibacter sp. PPCGB 2223]
MNILLNFINNSIDNGAPSIVIFQKNMAAGFDELAVAWKVLEYVGQGDNHPFTFPMDMQIGASDSWGNYMPQLNASNGQLFQVTLTASGDRLSYAGPATSAKEVQFRNGLAQGAINACIYKSGRLLAVKNGIAPNQQAAFEFKPTIWIGVASQVVQGEVMNSAIISNINTELSLLGVKSADIVMTGGGPGPSSTPYKFSLNNVVMA